MRIYPFSSHLKIDRFNKFSPLSSCQYCSLVAKICNISTTKSWGQCSQTISVFVKATLLYVQLHRFQVNQENFLTTFDVGKSNLDLTIKTPRTRKRRVQYLLHVCGS